MTCIAYKDGLIASDTQESFGTRKIKTVGKVFRMQNGQNKGHYICMSGASFVGQKLIEWYGDPKKKPPPVVAHDPDDDDALTEFLVVTPERKLFLLNESCALVPFDMPFYAIGSGGDYAMAAMRCGKTAEEAVQIACEYDCYCSPPIQTWVLPESRKGKR